MFDVLFLAYNPFPASTLHSKSVLQNSSGPSQSFVLRPPLHTNKNLKVMTPTPASGGAAACSKPQPQQVGMPRGVKISVPRLNSQVAATGPRGTAALHPGGGLQKNVRPPHDRPI